MAWARSDWDFRKEFLDSLNSVIVDLPFSYFAWARRKAVSELRTASRAAATFAEALAALRVTCWIYCSRIFLSLIPYHQPFEFFSKKNPQIFVCFHNNLFLCAV